ncbi:MAG: hypothetical protein FDZ75_00700 [Actinobacteria bacterium]|nr:MAG: hypothetical protein FDZ75_00700 [Actinomycetota bacterium]
MAITRRQFVTRLSTLAAAMGASQIDLAKITEALAHSGAWASGGWTNKPKVVWVHGAECTGCSTSLLSLFEDVRGTAIEGTSITTLAALDLAVGGNGNGDAVLPGAPDQPGHPNGHRTLQNAGLNVDNNGNTNGAYIANIADVLIDFIDLQYHETVMGMGGDLAYQYLLDLMNDTAGNSTNFVLVVEGAIQPKTGGGYWNKTTGAPWCSIGMGESSGEHSFDDVVHKLAINSKCAAIIPIGQCATFGGYPGAVSPVLGSGQTGAVGTQDFLTNAVTALEYTGGGAQLVADKLINVPGCPTNPWWFILSVVAWLVDATAILNASPAPLGILGAGLKINAAAVDSTRRLKAVYGTPLHGPYCTRYQSFLNGQFATVPGDPGCLQLLGCKGPQTMTLCGPHGWNSMNPRNDQTWDNAIAATYNGKGSNCIAAGHPCMSCTEKGYPDSFLPFVVR